MQIDFWYYVCVTFYPTTELLPEISLQVIFVWYMLVMVICELLEWCFLRDEHGPCSDSVAKWFYDSRDGVCKQFLFGGCQGNQNQFSTRDECELRCGNVQGKEVFVCLFVCLLIPLCIHPLIFLLIN
jgi:hypothetical protein